MAYRRKFERGPQIPNTLAAVEQIINGHWIYMNNKVQHPSWMQAMTLWTIGQFAMHGRLYYAIETRSKVELDA